MKLLLVVLLATLAVSLSNGFGPNKSNNVPILVL